MERQRLAGIAPAWCRHLTMSVRCLQDFSDHHGAAKCGKSERCMYECCQYRQGLARYFLRCMCCTLAMSARCKDHLVISLQCLYNSTVILLSSNCCLANILRQRFFCILNSAVRCQQFCDCVHKYLELPCDGILLAANWPWTSHEKSCRRRLFVT